MNRIAMVLAFLLSISIMMNAMVLHRVSRAPEPAKAPAVRPEPTKGPAVAALPESADSRDFLAAEISDLRREILDLRDALQAKGIAGGNSPIPHTTSKPTDPRIAELVGASESVDKLFADLRRLAKAREQIDAIKYQSTVLDATADALGLTEPARSLFLSGAQAAALTIDQAMKDRDAARQALPPYDPQNPKANRDAMTAINKAYQDQTKLAAEKVTVALDPNQPVQKQFISKATYWVMDFLAPAGGGGSKRQ